MADPGFAKCPQCRRTTNHPTAQDPRRRPCQAEAQYASVSATMYRNINSATKTSTDSASNSKAARIKFRACGASIHLTTEAATNAPPTKPATKAGNESIALRKTCATQTIKRPCDALVCTNCYRAMCTHGLTHTNVSVCVHESVNHPMCGCVYMCKCVRICVAHVDSMHVCI